MTWFYIALLVLMLVAAGAAMWWGRATLKEHPVRFFALIILSGILVFLAYLAVWLTNVLSSDAWCGRALQAERISTQGFGGLTACIQIFTIQVNALAKTLIVVVSSYAFSMLVIVVVVLVQGKASASGPGGWGVNIAGQGDSPIGAAVDKVVVATETKAAEVKKDAAAAEPPGPRPATP